MTRFFIALAAALFLASPALAQQDGYNLDTCGVNACPAGPLVTVPASPATATNSTTQNNPWASGISCVYAQTAMAGPLRVNISIHGLDLASSTYYTLINTGTLSPTSQTQAYRIAMHPGLTASAAGGPNNTYTLVNDFLPKYWRATVVTSGTATPTGATLGCSLVQ